MRRYDSSIRRKFISPRILDLGTGSGAILCALLEARPDAFGVGVDISRSACALASKNLAHCGFSNRSGVVLGDWALPLAGAFDLIVSNPPYISHDEITSLDHEVLGHDPMLALDGGADGLDAYRRIASELKRLLRHDGGVACLEIGWRQGKMWLTFCRPPATAKRGFFGIMAEGTGLWSSDSARDVSLAMLPKFGLGLDKKNV